MCHGCVSRVSMAYGTDSEEAKKLPRMIGEEAVGPPDGATRAAIERFANLERLEDLVKRARAARDWAELVGRPAVARKGGRRPSV